MLARIVNITAHDNVQLKNKTIFFLHPHFLGEYSPTHVLKHFILIQVLFFRLPSRDFMTVVLLTFCPHILWQRIMCKKGKVYNEDEHFVYIFCDQE